MRASGRTIWRHQSQSEADLFAGTREPFQSENVRLHFSVSKCQRGVMQNDQQNGIFPPLCVVKKKKKTREGGWCIDALIGDHGHFLFAGEAN